MTSSLRAIPRRTHSFSEESNMSHATRAARRRWFTTLAGVSAALAAAVMAAAFMMVPAHAQSALPPGFKAPASQPAASSPSAPAQKPASPPAPTTASPVTASPVQAIAGPVVAPNPFQSPPAARAVASPWLEFTFYTPPAVVLVAVLAIVLASILVAQFGVYRLALKPNVRAGVHPNVVANSVMVWTAGSILLATYVVLATFAAGTVGKGYFSALWAMVALATLLLTLFRLLIARWAVALLVVLAVAAIMLAFDII